MKIKEIMTYNVVSIPSNTSVAEAKRIMLGHKIKHLPVIDKGQLVGIVTDTDIEQVSPSKATSLSVWELTYLLEKTPVKDIMKKDVVTVDPDTDAEKAVAIAQKNKVGSAIVVEKNRVVGIVTTDDFFYKIINPILGIEVPGTRIEITDAIIKGKGAAALEKLLQTVHKLGYRINTLHIEGPSDQYPRDVCLHIDSEDVTKLIKEFESQGFKAVIRER